MATTPRGFPERFPIRDDGTRPWRYKTVSLLSRAVLRSLFGRGLQLGSMASFPATGPLLVVCNHLSNIDPFIFGGYGPGTLFCLAKRELYANRAVAWVLAGCNCFPIDRGSADRWALRMSLDLLEKGVRLLIFVEGTRSVSPGMKRAEAAVGFLARRSGATVMPVAIWGTEAALARGRHFPRRVPIRVRYGTPFAVPAPSAGTRRDDQAIADLIASRIAELLPEAYRGVYQSPKPPVASQPAAQVPAS